MPKSSKPSKPKRKRGRPKGSRNKRTNQVRAVLDDMDCNPVVRLAEFALDEDKEDAFRADCLKALLPYYAPRLQASQVELTAASMPALRIEYVKPE